jgi:hypothetical protein
VTTVLREKEYETATLLNSLPPISNPLTVAENAMGIARRRRMGGVVVWMTGAALAATIWVVAATLVIPALNRSDMRIASELRTETMPLSCLSPQQAADIINPYVRSPGSTYYIPSTGISAITVRGRPDELAKSRDLIEHFERAPTAACHVTEGSLLKPGSTFVTPEVQGGAMVLTAPDPMPATAKKK